MLKAAISLWSADLLNLESEIRRAEPYADAFHIDVADGRYAPKLLVFFPDLVKAIRAQTNVALEIHLIVQNAGYWTEPFAEAGADTIVFYPDSTPNPVALVRKIKHHGLRAGVSLSLKHPVSLIEPYLRELDLVVVLGTDAGSKGIRIPSELTYDKIQKLVHLRDKKNLGFEIEADGAIRRETIPALRHAGADIVVPGSLMFKNDMKEIHRWLRRL